MDRRNRTIAKRQRFDFSDLAALEWMADDLEETARSQRFVLTDSTISERLNQAIAEIYADAVDVAAAVHLADRRTMRGIGGRGFARSFELRLPVRRLDVWQSAPVRDALFAALEFATQDDWQLEFVPRVTPGRSSETQTHLVLGHGAEKCETLPYSGGLDSFAGLAARCAERLNTRFLCVSVTGNPRQTQRQREQLKLLQRTFGAKITHIPVDYHLQQAEQHRQERTRRTRGFLFLMLTAVTALVAGEDQLFLSENGVGAINLPQDGAQVGIDNTRSVHPIALQRMERLLTLLSGAPFRIHNEAVFQTKAQMCSHPAVALAAAGICGTFSCDGFPVRRKQFAQCGFCTSCLLRRQALEFAGLSAHDARDYGQDLTRDGLFLQHHRTGLNAMNMQSVRIEQCLRSSDPWTSLTVAFPELRRASESLALNGKTSDVRNALLKMYGKHVEEWQAFAAVKCLTTERELVAA